MRRHAVYVLALYRCLLCAAPLETRISAKYCSSSCRVSHFRRRARLRERLAVRRKCAGCRAALPVSARADAPYCSPRCRQAVYRRARAANPKTHVKARLADGVDVDPSLDLRSAEVREISRDEAARIIAPFEETLPALPAAVLHCYGVFFAGRIAGAVVYAAEPSGNLGVWRCYADKIIVLARGATLPN